MLLIFVCYLLAAIPCQLQAGDIKLGAAPAWITDIKPDLDAPAQTNEIENGYYDLLYDAQINVALHSYYYHITEKIINQSGVENCSQLEFHYDKAFENITIDKIHVIRDGKVINKLDLSKLKTIQQAKELSVLQYDERMTGLLILEDIKIGDIIDYSYTVTRNNPLFQSKFTKTLDMQFSLPIHALSYKILIPENRKISFKCLNGASEPIETSKNGIHTLAWSKIDVHALKMEDHIPVGYDPYPEVQLSEYKDWQDVKDWMKDIYQPVMVSGPHIKAKAANIAATYSSDTDKIIATLRFVQDQIRYLGIETGVNTHKPHLPESVLKQGYGDCKDKVTLFCSLLHEMNINACPVLIQTNASDNMMNFLPSPTEFNHVCAAVYYKGEYHFFDPTINYQRGTFSQTYFPYYKFGLLLSDTTPSLTALPFNAENTFTHAANRLDIGDTLMPTKLTVTTTYIGHSADVFRAQLADFGIDRLQQDYLNFYITLYTDIKEVEQLKVEKDDSITNTITTIESYTINNLWEYNEKLEHWHIHLTAQSLRAEITEPKNYNRSMPLRLEYPLNYKETFELHYPGNSYKDHSSTEVENNYLAYSITSWGNPEADASEVVYTLKSKTAQCPAEFLETYRKDIKKIKECIGYGITLPSPHASKADSSQSGLMWFILLLTACFTLYACIKAYPRYDVVTPYINKKPLAISGWLIIPAIGTGLICSLTLFGLYENKFTSEIYNDILFNKSATNYNPQLGAVVIFELICNVIALGIWALAAVLLFKKRSSFPYVFIAAACFVAVYHLMDYAAVTYFHLSSISGDGGRLTFFKSLIYCLIWVPYMLQSTRVKKTFTNWHPSKPLPEHLLITEPVIEEIPDTDTTLQLSENQTSLREQDQEHTDQSLL